MVAEDVGLEEIESTILGFQLNLFRRQTFLCFYVTVYFVVQAAFQFNLVTISGKRAFEVIGMNKKGMKPDSLLEEERKAEPKKPIDLLEQERVTRFDPISLEGRRFCAST